MMNFMLNKNSRKGNFLALVVSFYYSLINNNIINNRHTVRNRSVGHGKQVDQKEKLIQHHTEQGSQQKTQESTFGIAFHTNENQKF